ncbi:hypothetical protein [Terrimonas pollutisoli]|uniref:hypothetical protein n=1 Tax=Terrimonas pollutisoli TaxID=3034147 RepID=UPI0023EBCDB5|nr:hypothetical protein [Terrimonas sp. H1YJ31]
MSGNPKTQNLPSDDIDLLLLLERAILFFKKYKWVFIVAIISGLALGFLRYRSLPKVYKSRLVLLSTIALTNQNNIEITANWNALLNHNGYAELAAALNCPQDILSKVKSIKAEEIQKLFTPANPIGFTIDAWVTDPSVLPELQKGIVYGFDNSGYIKDRLAAKRTKLTELIEKTSVEINRLETTKQTVENIIKGKGVNTSSLIFDGSAISRQLVELNEKLSGFKEELKFTSSVQVLQSFGKSGQLAGPNLFVWLFIGLTSCLSIAFLFSLFSSINQKLMRRATYRKEKQN